MLYITKPLLDLIFRVWHLLVYNRTIPSFLNGILSPKMSMQKQMNYINPRIFRKASDFVSQVLYTELLPCQNDAPLYYRDLSFSKC